MKLFYESHIIVQNYNYYWNTRTGMIITVNLLRDFMKSISLAKAFFSLIRNLFYSGIITINSKYHSDSFGHWVFMVFKGAELPFYSVIKQNYLLWMWSIINPLRCSELWSVSENYEFMQFRRQTLAAYTYIIHRE